jgi:hypothetical protein
VPTAVPDPERGITPSAVGVQPDAASLAELAQLAAAGELTVRLGETFRLECAREGYALLARGGASGKIVVTI